MVYSLQATDDFLQGLGRLDPAHKERVRKILQKLKEDPITPKPLRGNWTYHRVRFDCYRLIYSVVEHEKRVVLLDIGKRDAIYRKYALD